MNIEELADEYNILRVEHTALQTENQRLQASTDHANTLCGERTHLWRNVRIENKKLRELLDKDLQSHAMANMSHHIAALKNQMTAEQILLATDGAAGPMLNARDEYDRAEAYKKAAKIYYDRFVVMYGDTVVMPGHHEYLAAVELEETQ